MRFLLVTGLSGAGKTSAIRYLEDMGAFCVDNLPPMMMINLMEACRTSGMDRQIGVFAVDVRSGEFFDADAVCRTIEEARAMGHRIDTVFLEAGNDVIVSRYKESRREHPLAVEAGTLAAAIKMERGMLQPLRETANYVIDTGGMKLRKLQETLKELAGSDGANEQLRVEIMSFGFKRALPKHSDLVIDVRLLPNPFYIESLRVHCGLDADVRDFVLGHPVTQDFMGRVTGMLEFLLPHYQKEGKHRIVIAIGCTGGAHRSVAIAEAVGGFLREKGYMVDVNHRDTAIEQARWKDARRDLTETDRQERLCRFHQQPRRSSSACRWARPAAC